MLQPFESFEERYLLKLIELKRRYVVTQTYTRAKDPFDPTPGIDLLLTDYDDEGGALIHFNAVRRLDRMAAIIRLDKPEHLAKLRDMMQGDQYRLFWCVVRKPEDLEKRLDDSYKDKARRYINGNTDWRIKGSDTVKSIFEVVFGELFVTLKWKKHSLRVKFEAIERS